MTRPAVSVLLPVRNGEAYLAEAMRSILAQTFGDLELWVVDDGSTDGSAALAQGFAGRDPRVQVLSLKGLGLAPALNAGLKRCRGELIARMDADDVSLPQRLERQVGYLRRHPETGLVGAFARTLGVFPPKRLRFPVEHEQIRASALFDSPVAHPTVCFRAALVRGRAFDPSFRHAEDYELWSRWMAKGVRFHCLPEVLLRYRVHPGQVRAQHRAGQLDAADRVRMRGLAALGLRPGKAELALHREAARVEWVPGLGHLGEIGRWLLKLWQADQAKPAFDGPALAGVLAQRWASAVWANRGEGTAAWKAYAGSPLAAMPHPLPWKVQALHLACATAWLRPGAGRSGS